MTLVASQAGAQVIVATVNRTEATSEDQIVLTVTVSGSRSAKPRLPALPAFNVVPKGTSSQVEIINGRMSTRISHNYVLIPKTIGTFSVGAASVEIDGRIYQSQPFLLRIVDAATQPRQSRELFIRSTVSNRTPYVGEQVIYTWRLYRRVQIAGASLEPQEFAGFLVEDLGEAREFPTTLDGIQFVVHELRKALFPQEVGTVTVPGSRLTCQVLIERPTRRRNFFDFGRNETQTKVLSSAPLELNVRPLPAEPQGFSRLVGEFALRATINKRDLKVGESATLKLTASGTGNVQFIGEPPFPDLSSFKIYDDKPAATIDRTGPRLKGSKSFHKALVPLESGEVVIPALQLIYFNPKSGSYETAATRAITLNVLPGDREELRLTESMAPTTGKVAVKILADDILPIYKGLDAISGVSQPWVSAALTWSGLVLPPMVFVGLLLTRRRQQRFHLDAALRRRRGALRKSLSELREVDREASENGHPAAAQVASRCLRGYVGDKLGVGGSALTPGETDALLSGHGVSAELAGETRGLLENLEAAQYGAAQDEGAQLVDTLRSLLKRLDREIRV